ncbi:MULTISPECIES: cation transporter [Flavobacteriaceae]|jgi:Co/Zn/Cd efflux system component|uniref:Cation diffusion facilitator family transporter n=9 Tax=Flavobacteriaceae TaxID=49546 RepID=A0A5C7B9E1_9FLAO|nr:MULTISPECIES: cation transporter [Flavobacteriaceae]MAD97278.1 cation transporter [Flavobacteriaceae bacterium]KFB00942.1 cation transporter [Mangrovimonas yunxiaonensis]MBB3125034.1 Co/Zn/Cd efflux system component [Mesoflavibacter zeaxanthinifaciens subsp. sabulilitoris]MBF8151439.1 cation transporter [Winogradskyella marina]PNQ75217.1 cation transporter [Hanstruepera neustonica]|tara:strand:+ start:664 stop:1455 length:792 start_codon:yes stop_codon:yes gene_type:complete
MQKTVFKISKMDCPSEENLIKMKLSDIDGIKQLDFNLEERILTLYHNSNVNEIGNALNELKLNESLISSEDTDTIITESTRSQSKLLWTVLIINFAFFIIEMSTGLISKSMGLVADSLDMLADSFVYGLSLIAVGGTVLKKKRIAKYAGYFQITLAIIGIVEVIRRFLGYEALPVFSTMIIVSVFALIANGICLYLLQKSKSQEAHMRASMIFTSNDIIINLGVITAGVLVNWLHSGIPDLIIGIIVFGLVIQGAFRILKLSK